MIRRALLALLLISGAACGSPLPPTTNVSLDFRDLLGQTINGTSTLNLTPHQAYTISGSDASSFTIPSTYSTVNVTDTGGAQTVAIVPNVAGTTGSVTYTMTPETYYDFVLHLPKPSNQSYRGKVRIPVSATTVTWASVTLTETPDGPTLMIPQAVRAGTGILATYTASTVTLSTIYGNTAGTSTQGDDSRIPTQAENDALVGTAGSPSSSNPFVTDQDTRNTNARTPNSHATSHASNGSDPVNAATLNGVTATPGATKVPLADGSGKLAYGWFTIGQGVSTLAAGDDNRFPSSGQKAALVGTAGTPGSLNPYVTEDDTRLEDDRPASTIEGAPGYATDTQSTTTSVDGGSQHQTRHLALVAGTGTALDSSTSGATRTVTTRAVYGTIANTATEGNDARIPTADEKAALAGTWGSPGAANHYVTDTDPRNINARAPTAHAATTHQSGQSDELNPLNMVNVTSTAGANKVPRTGSGTTLDPGWIPSLVARYQAGGAEPLSVEGLSGYLAGTQSITTTTGGDAPYQTKILATVAGHGITLNTSVTGGTRTNTITVDDASLAIAWGQLTGVPATFAPSGHHASHESGGSDEVLVLSLSNVTATPGDGKVPRTSGASTLAYGWFPVGSSASTLAPGDDSRFPSTGEKQALVGTDGTPSSSNKYVTNSDARNANARTPTAHASTHASGGGDAITMGGDTSGAPDTVTVVAVRGRAHGTAAPSTGHAWVWDGSKFAPDYPLIAQFAGVDVGTVRRVNFVGSGVDDVTVAGDTATATITGGGSSTALYEGHGIDLDGGPTGNVTPSVDESELDASLITGQLYDTQRLTIDVDGANELAVRRLRLRTGTAFLWSRSASSDTLDVTGSVLIGTIAGTAAAGDDARFPTSGEKAALAGTDGTPGSGNKYVTDSDARNTNARTPTAHASTHASGQSDQVDATGLQNVTATPGASKVPKTGGSAALDIGWIPTGQTGSTVPFGNDARFSDSRPASTIEGAPGYAAATQSITTTTGGDAQYQTRHLATVGGHGITLSTTVTSDTRTNTITVDDAALAIAWSQLTGIPSTFAPSAHKTSHENGGGDEISVAGLSGVLADPQTPATHASTHASGQSDQVDATGLQNVTATPADGKVPRTSGASTLAAGWIPAQTYASITSKPNLVVGPATSTNRKIPTFDGTTGALLFDNANTGIDSSGNLTAVSLIATASVTGTSLYQTTASTSVTAIKVTGEATGDAIQYQTDGWKRTAIGSTSAVWQVIGGVGAWTLTPSGLTSLSAGTLTQSSAASTATAINIASQTNGDTIIYNSGWKRLAKGTDGQILTLASGLPSWAGALPNVQTFTNGGGDTTWEKPSGARVCRVIMIGGGGAGGSGRRGAAASVRCGGGGGSPGAIHIATIVADQLGSTETVAVGAGGTGGTAPTANDTNGNAGGDGGDTTFSTLIAKGGGGGAGGTTASAAGGTKRPCVLEGFTNANTDSGSSHNTGGVPSSMSDVTKYFGTGAGAGGGITSGDSQSDGGAGQNISAAGGTNTSFFASSISGGSAGTTGGTRNGGDGNIINPFSMSTGGGGGAAAIGGSASGRGGDAAVGSYGGAGGGGGAQLNGTTGGRGGNATAGYLVVVTW